MLRLDIEVKLQDKIYKYNISTLFQNQFQLT